MLCSSCLRSVFRNLGRYTDVLHLNDIRKVQRVNNFRDLKLLSIIGRKMMVDTNSTAKDGDGGYASGGLKSEDGGLSCGYSSFRGKRMSMEDFYDIKTSTIEGKTVSLFGIFDGHGGSRAAEFLKGHLFENLMKHPKFISNTKLAISETYQKTDNDFLESEKETLRDDGSTASTAVLVGNHLYVANVGDSRTIISKAGQVIPLSDDHKPNRSDERKRIENAGGIIMWAGTWRVGGVLAMSRAFGNRMLKQFVVAEPEIQDMEINEELELLVLASDGLWDVVANEDAISLARQEEEPEKAARKLTETAFNRGSADNITCIVVKFHHAKKTGSDPVSTEQVNKPVGLNPESSEIDSKPTGLNPETSEKDCKPTGLNPESSEKDCKPDGLKNPESSEKDCKPDGLKNPESLEKDCKPDGLKNPESSQQQSGLGPVRSEQVNKCGEKN